MAASHLGILLCELEGINESALPPTAIYFDSKSAMAMGSSYRDTKHTRHIERRYHYVREKIANNKFSMKWITSEFQTADIGTKITPGPRHKFLVELIHIHVGDQPKQIKEG
jgi:hypothetical protein